MPYKTIEFIKPLITFIKTCPFLGQDARIDTMAYNTDAVMSGNALAYAGTGKPVVKKDVMGNVFISKQANFILYIRRPSLDDIYRLETADFLYNFEAWVEYENFFGTPPRFGSNAVSERMWADNGMYWQGTEKSDVTDYMIQIHVEYQIQYESEDDY